MATPLMATMEQSMTSDRASKLKERVARFVGGASTEIIPSDEARLPELAELLPPRSAVYVAHPPNSTLPQVVKTALAAQRAGFAATPHIVARRIDYAHTLRLALSQLLAGGVDRVLLVAGDIARGAGEFDSTLAILDSGLLEQFGIKQIGVAGHPQGHRTVASTALWDSLRVKQAFAERTGIGMHVVTQFSLVTDAVSAWERQFESNGIRLPIHAGIAGPASVSKLIRFAALCGVGAFLQSAKHNWTSVGNIAKLATLPDQHVMSLMKRPSSTHVVSPHFYTFGGVLETARWINRVGSGHFDIDFDSGTFRIEY
jgi:methylenetetrahydrofolate reductase (NADH)